MHRIDFGFGQRLFDPLRTVVTEGGCGQMNQFYFEQPCQPRCRIRPEEEW